MRTPIVPGDVPFLIQNAFTVYIQSSSTRIYSDNDYSKKGAIVTREEWFHPMFRTALIVGLKELDNLDKLNRHTHIYFSHSYKNQSGSSLVLDSFRQSNSLLYDFEYFTRDNKRLLSFGYQAGKVGSILGLLCHQKLLKSVTPITLETYFALTEKPKIGILGPNGKVGSGVRSTLEWFDLSYTGFDRNSDKENLSDYDLLFNCISLDKNSTEVWFHPDQTFKKRIVICDISCDTIKPNNPIRLYTQNTTWENPVTVSDGGAEIISITNLPSLIPKESSDYFSKKFVKLLTTFGDSTWQECLSKLPDRGAELLI